MATNPGLVRPSLTIPVPTTVNKEPIKFLHPGYDAPNNVLFGLPRVDAAGDSTTLGVCHATALVACQIIANNAWTGRLAKDKDGQELISPAPDDVLMLEEYYFIVEDSPLYPVVPSFRDWPFPHHHIPPFWPSVSVSPLASDSCILTNSSYSKNRAHLVPREEGDWFKYNSMGQYGLNRKDTEDSANLVTLRGDVHTWLDARGWTIAPKATPEGYRYVANVLDTVQAPEFYSWYHNVQLRLSGKQARAYIFTRFAWTMIQLVKPFLISSSSRAVVHIQVEPGKAAKWVEEMMQPDQLDKLYGGGGSRSASPNKRRKQSSTRNSSAYNDDLSFDAEVERLYNRNRADEEARVYAQELERTAAYDRLKSATKRRRSSEIDDDLNGLLEDWEERGRPRKRRSSTTTNDDNGDQHGKLDKRGAWTADHEDDARIVSTVASPGRESCSIVQSDVDCLEDEEDLSTCMSAPPVSQFSLQNDIDAHVGEVIADVPPEQSEAVSS